jgi:hypothetical protein
MEICGRDFSVALCNGTFKLVQDLIPGDIILGRSGKRLTVVSSICVQGQVYPVLLNHRQNGGAVPYAKRIAVLGSQPLTVLLAKSGKYGNVGETVSITAESVKEAGGSVLMTKPGVSVFNENTPKENLAVFGRWINTSTDSVDTFVDKLNKRKAKALTDYLDRSSTLHELPTIPTWVLGASLFSRFSFARGLITANEPCSKATIFGCATTRKRDANYRLVHTSSGWELRFFLGKSTLVPTVCQLFGSLGYSVSPKNSVISIFSTSKKDLTMLLKRKTCTLPKAKGTVSVSVETSRPDMYYSVVFDTADGVYISEYILL